MRVVPDALGSCVRPPAGEPLTIGERAFDDGDRGKFATATVDDGSAMLSRIRAACVRRLSRLAERTDAAAGRSLQVIPLAEENSNEPQSDIRAARGRL